MTKSLDDLIGHLLDEIALSGESGRFIYFRRYSALLRFISSI